MVRNGFKIHARRKDNSSIIFLYLMDERDAAEGSEASDAKMFQHVYTERSQPVILVDN